jgi:hypothetical protein
VQLLKILKTGKRARFELVTFGYSTRTFGEGGKEHPQDLVKFYFFAVPLPRPD